MLASVHEVDVHEVDSARSSKQGSSLLEVGLLRARAQTKVDKECFSESCQVCAVTVKVPVNLTIFPKTTQIVKKLPN